MSEQNKNPPPLPSRRAKPRGEGRLGPDSAPPAGKKAIGKAGARPLDDVQVAAPALEPPVPLAAPLDARKEPSLWGGKIQVHEEIDRGGMGYVLRGTDTKLRRELAIKVSPLPSHELQAPQFARFVEEAQVTAQLEHPNVVPVHDLGVDPQGRVYFSMKLVRGRSLEAILEGRAAGDPETCSEFGLRRLLDVFLQVCQAIEYAHARGVIHRDLKPANIMVGDFGEVLVMDWGVAKVKGRADHPREAPVSTEASAAGASPGSGEGSPYLWAPEVSSVRAGKPALATQSGAVVGTPAYMSPEQAKGLPVDERTDLYSLGVILYEILCGQVPFDDDDPAKTLVRVMTEAPRRPSSIDPSVPIALETLALMLLEKDPDRRSLSIAQTRAHVQDYIEGIGREFRAESLLRTGLWVGGAALLFAFVVWYLTGQSVTSVFVLAPPTVLNAVGWFLLIVALGYPLWSSLLALRQARSEHDRFRPATEQELFFSGYLTHRTFAAALAPLFQLIFIVELVVLAATQVGHPMLSSAEVARRIAGELRAEWAQSLIVILLFLFAYLFLMSSEVRFARQIDRYELLVTRPRWEAVWPVFLIAILLLTIGATDVLDWAFSRADASPLAFLHERVQEQVLRPFEILKTLVFQTTFLLGLVLVTLLVAFPFSEVLAALRLPYQPADAASARDRSQYFLRSLAIFRVARIYCLYGGAAIACLTAITSLSGQRASVVEQVVYILAPALVGVTGYRWMRGHVASFLAHAPAVARMAESRVRERRAEQRRVNAGRLRQAPLRHRIAELAVPVGCVVLYLVWTGTGFHQQALKSLMMPVTTKGWLLILPYLLLVAVLLLRDPVARISSRKRAP